MVNEHDILLAILQQHHDSDKWNGQPFEHIKRISNTKVGDVGQDFVEALCDALRLQYEFPLNRKGEKARQSPWDIRIEGVEFEIKTATEDVKGKFQFNHIRYHRDYDALITIGISPTSIYMGVWSKSDIVTNKAGKLVTMEKDANASFKITKQRSQLSPIKKFEDRILGFVTEPR